MRFGRVGVVPGRRVREPAQTTMACATWAGSPVVGGVLQRGEVALGVQGGGAAGAGRGDGLAVGVVDDVAAGEHAGQVGAGRRAVDQDVALVVAADLAARTARCAGRGRWRRTARSRPAGTPRRCARCAPATPSTLASPTTSTTSVSQRKRIFSLAKARSCMIFEARRLSRRCTIVTERANRVRKVASSIAVSPPPTTAMSWSRKKKPSQVAHHETPRPESRFSLGRPSSR